MYAIRSYYAEHGADVSHLEHEPLQRVVALARVLWQELAGLLGQVPQDRARLHHRVAPAAWSVGVDNRRDLVVGAQFQVLRCELV